MKKIKSYVGHIDRRGTFRGIINRGSWEEANFISTRAGEVRGGHYHKLTDELFYIISGKVVIEIENIEGDEIERFEVTEGDIFLVEPFEVHTFTCLEDSSWINLLSIKFDDKTPDMYLP